MIGQLSEVERIPRGSFLGGDDDISEYRRDFVSDWKSYLRPLSKNNHYKFFIQIGKQGPVKTKIESDIMIGILHGSRLIGYLMLDVPYAFPKQARDLQVNTITVSEDYRGRGIARALYGIVLSKMKNSLISGSSQTPGGRKNWVGMSKIPGVSMWGYCSILNPENSDQWNKMTAARKHEYSKSLTGIRKKLDSTDAEYIGSVDSLDYFIFSVESNAAETEMTNSILKIYQPFDSTRKQSSLIHQTGLVCFWSGK